MYNEFAENITKESDPVRQNIIQQKTLIGKLHQYFFLQIFLYYIIHT